jgi:hypothetical protein
MFRLQPLSGGANLRAGAVDQNVRRTLRQGAAGIGWTTANFSARRLTVVWSGAEIVTSINARTNVIKPSACRHARDHTTIPSGPRDCTNAYLAFHLSSAPTPRRVERDRGRVAWRRYT